MSTIIDTKSLSYDTIKADILKYVKNRPEWSTIVETSSMAIIIELVSGLASYLAYQTIVSRRESYLQYAKLRSSKIGLAEDLGYSVYRGSNPKYTLNVIPDTTVIIEKFQLVGTYGNYEVHSLEDKALNKNEETTLQVVIGDLESESITCDSNEIRVFKFVSEDISEDFMIYYNSSPIESSHISRYLIDLVYGKWVVLSNAYGGVNIYYLNPPTKVDVDFTVNLGGNYLELDFVADMSTGTKVALSSTDTLPSPLTADKDYYIIRLTESTVRLATSFVNAVRNVPITLLDEGVGTHTLSQDRISYNSGDTITIDFIKYAGDVIESDFKFLYGTVDSYSLLENYKPPEALREIEANAPFYHEVQMTIRGREDYAKLFKTMDTRIIDTNGIDISPAVVGLSYILNDLSLLSDEEKDDIIDAMEPYRPFGISPPIIYDPTEVTANLKVTLYLRSGVVISSDQINDDVDEVLDEYDKKLGSTLDLISIEDELEQLSYVKVARVQVQSGAWQAYTSYTLGQSVTPTTPNGRRYECITSGTSSAAEPTWPTSVGDTIMDGSVIWKCKNEGDTLEELDWNFYYKISKSLSIEVV